MLEVGTSPGLKNVKKYNATPPKIIMIRDKINIFLLIYFDYIKKTAPAQNFLCRVNFWRGGVQKSVLRGLEAIRTCLMKI
jgi:hypothetical protein